MNSTRMSVGSPLHVALGGGHALVTTKNHYAIRQGNNVDKCRLQVVQYMLMEY